MGLQNFEDLKEDLKDLIRTGNREAIRQQANTLINSLKICDPAVGSGHFLVSCLNELIAIKSELGLLIDKDGKRLNIYIQLDNDELIIEDENEDLFVYKPNNPASQRIQETLFHEKQSLIENCLFGVDINPNSVKICRLRLWIELLKNAYYTLHPLGEDGRGLQTLPNIDINIKTGNSLISRFGLDDDLKTAFKSGDNPYTLQDYKNAVKEYKGSNDKTRKRDIIAIINTIKSAFKSSLDTKFKKRIADARGKYEQKQITLQNLEAFGEKPSKKELDELKKLALDFERAETEKEEMLNNAIYQNAFEWRFEFPEVLDENADFIGFDVVIGNPPYISNWDLSENNRAFVEYLDSKYKAYLQGHWDLFSGFIVLANKIMINEGLNSYILPTSFYKEKHSTDLRKFFLEEIKIIELLDFQQLVVFDDVARQTGIYIVQKIAPNNNLIKVKSNTLDLGSFIEQSFYLKLKNYAFKTSVNEADISIYSKLNNNTLPLGVLFCINTGVVAHAKKESSLNFTKDDVIHNEYQVGYKKYIKGNNLSPYSAVFENEYMDYDSKIEHFHRPKYPLLFESPKIIIRRISGKDNQIIAFYDKTEHYYSNDNLMHIIKWNEQVLEYQKPEKKWEIVLDSPFALEYILAILCSKMSKYFFSKFLSTDTLQGTYSSIYPEDIRQIPIKELSINKQQPIIALVDKILTAKAASPSADTTAIEREIDVMVYKLYGLTYEEVKVVDKDFWMGEGEYNGV